MFAESYTFATASQFSYNSNITLAGGIASLTPLTTSYQSDFNSTQFNAGTSLNTAWDSTLSCLRLSPTNANVFSGYYTGFEGHDFILPATDAADAVLGTNNVTGYGCGNSTVYGHVVQQGNAFTGAGAFLYSGSAQQGNTYAFMTLVSLQNANLVISNNATLSYWIYPSGLDLGNGTLVNGSNSAFAALDVVFKDGSDTRSVATIVDANGIALNPNSQGSGNKLKLNQWNQVRVALGALAGKTVDHIDVGWQRTNATLGYLGFIDDVFIVNVKATKLYTNTAALDATWAPQYGNLKGYWPMDGNGFIGNGNSVAATVGTALSPNNKNQTGMAYVNGRVGQGIYLDGVDDYLSISGTNFPNSTSMTFAAWVSGVYANDGNCHVLLSIGSSSADLDFSLYCSVPGLALGTQSDYIAASPVSSGAWTHVAFTYDSSASNANLYINGRLDTAHSVSTPLSSWLGNTPIIGRDNNPGNTNPYYSGIIDEVAVWGSVLNANEIALLYSRQSAGFSGTFTSRVMGSPFYNAGATGMNWNTTLPFYKPLTGNDQSETTASYPSLFSGGLDANLLIYWNFEETAFGTISGGGDFADNSNSGYTGYAANLQGGGSLPLLGRPGRFNNAAYFDASADYGVWEAQSFNNPQVFTLQAWFQTLGTGGLIQFSDTFAGYPGGRDRMLYVGASGFLNFGTYPGYFSLLRSTSAVNDGYWHHAVGLVDASGNQKLYVDGVLEASASGISPQVYSGYWSAGFVMVDAWPDTPSRTLLGSLDEVAIWDRALDASEVAQLYRRGANRQKFQLRTCTSATCADNPNWLGPDGTSGTYFSELENVSGGAVQPNAANLQFAYVAPSLAVNSNNAYMQYRAILESDDTSNQCTYGGTSGPCSPETKAVNFTANTYNSGSPNVTIKTAGALTFSTLSSMAQTLGPVGCPQGVTYALSSNGTTWYYYTSSWATTNGSVANSNSAAALSAQMSTFQAAAGAGKIYFSAFLHSNGLTPCALQGVTFGP